MNTISLPCPVGSVSDGYHTFDELYSHRILLFLALMKFNQSISWISMKHGDGGSIDGWFVAGMHLPSGDITYHIPIASWSLATLTGAKILDKAPEFDGHTSNDVLSRLSNWIV